MSNHEYTQGVCQDGAAILKDGAPMTIEEILAELRAGNDGTSVPDGGAEWLIQMRGDYLITRGVWERPEHRGYTNDISEAGRYSESEAKEAERVLPEKCKAVRLPVPASHHSASDVQRLEDKVITKDNYIGFLRAQVKQLKSHSAEPQSSASVPMPQDKEQARAMALTGMDWLRDNAPGELKEIRSTPWVPEWMAEISGNLKTQDNRITADPLFVVFQKREIVVDEAYDHDRIAWVGDEGQEPDEETTETLDDLRNDPESEFWTEDEITLTDDEGTAEWRRLALKSVDEFVTACFTEVGAKGYLDANGHNLRLPYIFVTSLYRNEEMKRLREWLISIDSTPQLTPEEKEKADAEAEEARNKFGGCA